MKISMSHAEEIQSSTTATNHYFYISAGFLQIALKSESAGTYRKH